MKPLHDLRVAIGFLTRVPVGDVGSNVKMSAAVPWFPVVAGVIGLVHAGVWRGMVEVTSPLLAAAIATAAALLVTGAFHHDGLADCADAFGGGWTVEQRFEILKDSRLGTYGTASLATALLIEVAAVASLSPDDGFGGVVAAHIIGRCVAMMAMLLAPVGGDGLGAAYMRDLSWVWSSVGIAAGLAAVWFVSPVLFVWPVLAGCVAGAAVVALSIRKIGGITGDALGAIAVCAMLAALTATVAFT